MTSLLRYIKHFYKPFILSLTGLLIFCAHQLPLPIHINLISLDMDVKRLHDNKVVEAHGTVYYQYEGGGMVTHFTQPEEMLIITNNEGEMKSYDVQKNMIMQNRGGNFSSRNSHLYYFLSGRTEYMGLKEEGFVIKDTRIENEMIITVFEPPAESNKSVKKVELVHEDHNPIFLGYYNSEGQPVHKTYYDHYKSVGNMELPMRLTEFKYLSENDSLITRRTYSNVKINEAVNDSLLNYKIPSNAKVVK